MVHQFGKFWNFFHCGSIRPLQLKILYSRFRNYYFLRKLHIFQFCQTFKFTKLRFL